MPRYLVERTYSENLILPGAARGAQARLTIAENNALDGVTWVHSYLTPDGCRSFCIYDAPAPLPVDRISEVRVLDPYLYL